MMALDASFLLYSVRAHKVRGRLVSTGEISV